MTSPSILIQFDPETWKPIMTFLNGATDIETEKLQAIAQKMLENIQVTPETP